MAGPRKIFRVEEAAAVRREPAIADSEEARRHGEIMRELAALRAVLAAAPRTATTPRERAGRDGPRSQAAQLIRVAQELDAVRKSSEEATQKILAAAEDVDQAANNLSAALKDESEQGLAQDIRDRVVQIFEACNFQDVTSQSVAKVMATLNRIEQQMTRGLDPLAEAEADAAASPRGPRLESDRGHVSQGEIDAMFRGGLRSA